MLRSLFLTAGMPLLLALPQTRYVPEMGRNLKASECFTPNRITQPVGHRSAEDWAQLIDQTWGTGLPTADKLRIFDSVWFDIHNRYGAFHHTEIDLQAIYDRDRPEIEAGVSRGRFAAIMTHFMHSLQELHTNIADIPVVWGTPLQPGVPVMVVGAWGDVSHFGAALTPMPDGSALVYRVTPNHVLGLEPGDLVLGYDGIPWPDLVEELMTAQLPLRRNGGLGSTPTGVRHSLIMAVGENWHLFDQIDIRKHATGDTVSMSTQPLINQSGQIYGNEQLPVAGVSMPNWFSNNHLTWGRISDTNIGYVYVGSWSTNPAVGISNKFHRALTELSATDGLIVDFRRNLGGYMLMAHRGYEVIFNRTLRAVAFDVRGNDPNDFLGMKPHPQFTANLFSFFGDPQSSYEGPIAVLTGPGAQSNGDWESTRMRLHENVRSFGKPTNGGFTSSDNPNLRFSDWWYQKATGSGYMLVDHAYLTHRGTPVDEAVWLEPDDVVAGVDTVVERARDWIEHGEHPAGYSAYLPHLVHGDGEVTWVSLTNPNPREATLHLEAFNVVGASYGPSTAIRAIAPNSRVTLSMTDLFPALTSLVSWVRLTSDQEIAIYTELKTDETASAYRPPSQLAAELFVPHVALDSEKFITEISAVNAAPHPTTLALRSDSIQQPWSGFGAAWSRRGDDILQLWSGSLPSWLRVESDAAQIAATEIFAYIDGTQGQAALELGHIASNQLQFLHIAADTANFWTGIVYLNPGTTTADVNETYFDARGQIIHQRDHLLEAGNKITLLSDATSPLAQDAAWLRVSSDSDLVGYELFGSAESLPTRYLVGLWASTKSNEQLIFDHWPRSDSEWTGLVAVNLGEREDSLVLELIDASGQILGQVTAPPQAPNQKATWLARHLFPDLWREGAWIRAGSDEGAWAGFLLWGDQARQRLSAVNAVSY